MDTVVTSVRTRQILMDLQIKLQVKYGQTHGLRVYDRYQKSNSFEDFIEYYLKLGYTNSAIVKKLALELGG